MDSQFTLQSSMYFLRRDPLYDSEKVYEIRRKELKAGIPRTNADLEKVEGICIQNMRGMNPSLAEHGFCCMNLDTNLQPEDFQNESRIVEEYFPKLTQAVKASLGADRIQIYDFIRRKRHPDFPKRVGNIDGVSQPATSAHIDETQADAKRVLQKINPTEFSSLSKMRWQVLIAWHPIRGPVRDWPLAVCDRRSVNVGADLQPCDLIHPNHISEEYKVHYATEQKWYYLQDQMPNEVFLLLQADSEGSTGLQFPTS
ncbi:hypothetical protein NM208_g3055 [Fusarium decemcellulare]|uniref:Uncharacterized protein n=1 Tax=Fusarium decemcellulare TaxID=57161 RepID=A0ACC1SQA6_9HYPO|nr:hypothetical protein NM208_g3055 [Fusarium decemcellulare]